MLAEGSLAELREAAGEREIIALRGEFRAEAVPAVLGPHADIQLIKGDSDELLFSVTSAERELSVVDGDGGRIRDGARGGDQAAKPRELFIKLTGRALRE